MSENKDFLSQFSGNSKKPASFQEETRTPVYRQKKPVNKGLLIAMIALIAIVGIVSYLVFLAPNIEMPDFVYSEKSEVIAWIKQQGIETSGVIFKEEYDFDNDEGIILSQDVKAGTKIRSDDKLTFMVSKGADPDDFVDVPDLMSMDKDEIKQWIQDNKLTKTKISTVYSEEIEEDYVIDYQFSGCDEESFTRSSTLKISVSKGAAPAGSVTMEDFVKRTYEEAESWAKTKNVNISRTDAYSDKIAEGVIISQSIASGKTIKEGETFGVVVSLGKSVVVENLVGMTSSDAASWCSKNGLTLNSKEQYDSNDTKGKVIYQTTSVGKTLKSGDEVEVVISLGNIEAPSLRTERELKEWVEQANAKGAGLTLRQQGFDFSDTVPAGEIMNVSEIYTDATVYYQVSRGKNIWIADSYDTDDYGTLSFSDIKTYDEDQARALLEKSGVTYHVDYESGSNAHMVKDAYVSHCGNRIELVPNMYVPQDETVVVVIETGE